MREIAPVAIYVGLCSTGGADEGPFFSNKLVGILIIL